MTSPRKLRVLVVDDAAAVREALSKILDADPGLEVLATAPDPIAAARRISKEVPDVITLDIDTPQRDGLRFLDKLMKQHPIPVVIFSSLASLRTQQALAAMQYGAVVVVDKPSDTSPRDWTEAELHICAAVHAATRAAVGGLLWARLGRAAPAQRPTSVPVRVARPQPAAHRPIAPKQSATAVLPFTRPAVPQATEPVIAIGASTGGTEALLALLRSLPPDAPGIVIVQHMPERFTGQFAARLDSLCAIHVKEAASGDPVLRGQALLAPGDHHMILERRGGRYHVEIVQGAPVNRHRPSVDVLFRSVARCAGANAIGVILTGMGDDGARGMLEMKLCGAHTVAQDEASCVVFGMPSEAIKRGGVDRVLPLDQIASAVVTRDPGDRRARRR